MPRIKIEDLPVLEELGEQQMKGVFGGFFWEGEVVLNPFRWADTGLYDESPKGDRPQPRGAGSLDEKGQEFRQHGW